MKVPTERVWRCCDRSIDLSTSLVMGIVNVTPDSFSDGGRCFDAAVAIRQGLQLVEDGADLLDIGGESTRPGADDVSEAEELRRVMPVVSGLNGRCGVPISVDTRRPAVARAAIAAGACIINDVMPLTDGPEMADVVRESGCGLVTMHMRGTPKTMLAQAVYEDVVAEVEDCLAAALAQCAARGIARDRVVIDPGIGFAKTTRHNLELMAAVPRLARLAPVLIGASRKRFIGELCDEPAATERLGGSVGAAVWCALHGAAVVRVHDVKATRQALKVAFELDQLDGAR
ncbi:MAG: dihydropteroate synthase [Kiritimatiellae bacterium]|nr:dihydropteroate synthase [Kiritimatiellia bacterium]